MKLKVLDGIHAYDGCQIKPLWAHSVGVKGNSIVAFRGPMDVKDILDMEDVHTEIRGDDLVHFIVERFAYPATMWSAYLLQRLLVLILCEQLAEYGIKAVRAGDDVYVDGGKLTVCIASASASSEKVHCGVNISASGTPPDVSVSSLSQLVKGWGDESWKELAQAVGSAFVQELGDIEQDIAKTRAL
ncbi:MAG: DUF366 family protein [Methermicoccaceae archaeon]